MTIEPAEGARVSASADRWSTGAPIQLLLVVAGSISGGFGIGAAVQTATFYTMELGRAGRGESVVSDLLVRLLVNLIAVAFSLVLMAIVRLERRSGWTLAGLIAIISALTAGLRVGLQWALRIELEKTLVPNCIEFIGAFFVVALGAAVGCVLVRTISRLRAEENRSYSQSMRASAALAALQAEELRVRRQVAEGLHGSLQQRLVLFGASIDGIVQKVTQGGSRNEAVVELLHLREDLDQLRQVDVREMSQMLYPDGLEVGFVQAARIMIRRVPSTIAVDLQIDHGVTQIDTVEGGLTELQRLTLIRIMEEGISNALRHGRASRLNVQIGLEHGVVSISLEDDGSGLPGSPRLGGLGLLGNRLELQGGRISLVPSPRLGGAWLKAELPTQLPDVDVADGEPE